MINQLYHTLIVEVTCFGPLSLVPFVALSDIVEDVSLDDIWNLKSSSHQIMLTLDFGNIHYVMLAYT